MSRKSVRDTYERIGAHFSKTRVNPWPEVESFLNDRYGTLGVDIGCGNGRHTELLAARTDRTLGIDASRALLAEARERTVKQGFDAAFVLGDAGRLALRGGCVDVAVYVATLHHLPTETARRASLAELARVLSPGGRALVSVWATTHDRFDATEGFDTEIDWTLPGGETVPRFYHIYAPSEFRAAVEASPLALHDFSVSAGNCYAVVGPEE